MQLTDDDIKLSAVSAEVQRGIEAAQRMIAELAAYRADLQHKMIVAENHLGELIAYKLLIDQHRRV